MPAARCSPCDLMLPKDKRSCPACGLPTWRLNMDEDTYDVDWPDQVEALKNRHQPGQPIPNVDCEVTITNGLTYAPYKPLWTKGYVGIASGDIVYVNGDYYTVLDVLHPEEPQSAGLTLQPVAMEVCDGWPVLTEHKEAT